MFKSVSSSCTAGMSLSRAARSSALRHNLLRGGVVRKASTWKAPAFENQEPRTFAADSPERAELETTLSKLRSRLPEQIPIVSGGKPINTNYAYSQLNPSRHREEVAKFSGATPQDVNACIDAALASRAQWSELPYEDRAKVFLRAADLVSGKYANELVAATMLGQSKNAWQAEIDAVAEIADFFRSYVAEGWRMQQEQPAVPGTPGVTNRIEYRALDGFVYAVSPFNFTALGATLVGAPALMGNPVIWKPSQYAVHASWILYQVLLEAGLPQDVVQFVTGDAKQITDVVLQRREFAGLSYIGSTAVLKQLVGKIGQATAADTYECYPRVVGETGGKNYHLIHPSANITNAVLHTVRASFELAGQKCSACSRLYVAESVWPEFRRQLIDEVEALRVGEPEDHKNFINAIIHEEAFDKLADVMDRAKSDANITLLVGGTSDKSEGYYVRPTVYESKDPKHEIMSKELFGPLLSVYVYKDADWESMPTLIDSTTSYALTGAVFAEDEAVLKSAEKALRYTAGNFYLNSKCTGAVVGQQPFGGSRDSGTNDKTGTMGLLMRWANPRTVKQQHDTIDRVLYPSNY